MQSKKKVGLTFIKNFYMDFICPYCKEKIYLEGESVKCINKHTFDITKKGTINFIISSKIKESKIYKEKLFTMKEQYQDQIEINYGIELGLMPSTLKKCSDFVKDEPFDFIIGSTHIVDFMDPYDAIYFETYPAGKGLAHYFEDILKNVSSFNDYCVYGHIDYAARYIKDPSFEFHYSDYSDLLDTILKKIIDHGKGIEVNTAGLKYGMSDPNPHHDIIKRYMELGGEIITIGSDGHCPRHMAYDFHKLPDFLSNLGIRYYTIFRNKKPEFIKL